MRTSSRRRGGGQVSTFAAVLSRQLATGDPYDRDIDPELPLLAVWAYGTSSGDVSYHGPRRGAATLHLNAGGGAGAEAEAEAEATAAAPGVPADAEGHTDLVFGAYELPSRLGTYYACQGFDLSGGPKRHIVAMEPLIQAENAAHVHHVVVHRCRPGEFFDAHRAPVACNPGGAAEDEPLEMHPGESPAGASEGACRGVVYVWAAGAGMFVLPEAAGIPIGGGEDSHLVVEIHYDNPTRAPGIVDSSGFRLHWAERRLREHDASTMVVGDALVARDAPLPPGVAEEHRQYTCPEECTRKFSDDVQIFATAPHMHYKGRSIWTTVSRPAAEEERADAGEGGSFVHVADLDRKEYWNNGFQSQIPQAPGAFTLRRGDRLNTHCVFDTTRAERPVAFGSSTEEEMCMDFLFYYPRQMRKSAAAATADDEIAYCGALPGPSRKQGFGLYVCGSPGSGRDAFIMPGNADLSDKWDAAESPGGEPSYRFDEGRPASAAEARCAPAAANGAGSAASVEVEGQRGEGAATQVREVVAAAMTGGTAVEAATGGAPTAASPLAAALLLAAAPLLLF